MNLMNLMLTKMFRNKTGVKLFSILALAISMDTYASGFGSACTSPEQCDPGLTCADYDCINQPHCTYPGMGGDGAEMGVPPNCCDFPIGPTYVGTNPLACGSGYVCTDGTTAGQRATCQRAPVSTPTTPMTTTN